jgi:hypothetical protein
MKFNHCKPYVIACTFLVLSIGARAQTLTDNQLYFDPDSLAKSLYTRILLPDLSSANSFVWSAGSDAVVDADILPILKPGTYASGYLFTQADYLLQPNVDYNAALTSGSLTATFEQPGLYHVRVNHQSGASEIFAVFAEFGLKEDGAKDKTGTTVKMDPLPDADLFLVEQRDATIDNSAEIWKKNGKTVERTTSRQDVIDKIKKKSEELKRKIHVELDGHGRDGYISTGGGAAKGADFFIDLSNVKDFQKAIDPYVNKITFQSCNTGKGTDGAKFLEILKSSIGSAGAWDTEVGVVDQSYFTIGRGGQFVKSEVPEPSAFAMFFSGGGLVSIWFWKAKKKS